MPKTNGGKVMNIYENQHENGPEINRKFIKKRVVCERCLMQNNVLKPIFLFKMFMVCAVQQQFKKQ